MAARSVTATDPIELRFLRPAPGIILTWFALLVLKLATILLESTELKLILLLLLLLLFWNGSEQYLAESEPSSGGFAYYVVIDIYD